MQDAPSHKYVTTSPPTKIPINIQTNVKQCSLVVKYQLNDVIRKVECYKNTIQVVQSSELNK